jgi:two-component system, sensor histidine kinase and response regulator
MITTREAESLPFNYALQKTLRPLKSFKQTKKILMIEDDLDMADLISNTLKIRFHCAIDIAQDPFEAMNLMTDKFYDLIILDWQLPGLNGTETLVQAEKGLKLDPGIPIFTSSKRAECLPRRTKHFNYVGFISKSQSLDSIISALGEYIQDEKTFRYQTA